MGSHLNKQVRDWKGEIKKLKGGKPMTTSVAHEDGAGNTRLPNATAFGRSICEAGDEKVPSGETVSVHGLRHGGNVPPEGFEINPLSR